MLVPPLLKEGSSSSANWRKAHIVGLLFAAEWCPNCTPFLPRIRALHEFATSNGVDMQIYFISSDGSAEKALEYYAKEHGPWHVVTLEAGDELKVRFKALPKKDMERLGLDARDHGIPAFLIIDPRTGAVLDGAGADAVAAVNLDNKKTCLDLLQRWTSLRDATSCD